jgi:hypothetical protein
MLAQLAGLAGIVSVTIQLVLFIRWLHRRMRDDEIMREFVRDLAEVQLPYMHAALRGLAAGQGVQLEEPPLIRFVALNGRKAS